MPLASIVPSVALPPRMGLVPAAPTYQSSSVVAAPVTVDVKVFVLAVPEGIVQEVGEIVTIGGGVIVTVEVADTFVSSKDVAETVTAAGEGAVFGARYSPLESILPTVSSPPTVSFTFQMMIEFVPPETNAEKRVVVATFTEMVTGEIVTVIPVNGSVHEEEEEELETVVSVVVQVTAVLGAAEWHEAKPATAISTANRERRFTARLFSDVRTSIPAMLDLSGSLSTHLSKARNYISILLQRRPSAGTRCARTTHQGAIR
jgi:hypothetical protein